MALSHEYSDIGPVSVTELADVEIPAGHELVFVQVPGQQPEAEYETQLTHSPGLDKRNPAVSIRTAERSTYLKTATETEAQDALRKLTHAVHELVGGVVDIHPFFGGIYGDILNPVAKSFRRGPGDIIPDWDTLSTRIALVPEGGVFSDTISEDAAEIPLSFTLPSPEADRFMANMLLANHTNPNQRHKDQAAANGLLKPWQAEFDRYNPEELLRREPMVITPGSVSLLMGTLSDRGVFDSEVATVRVRQPA